MRKILLSLTLIFLSGAAHAAEQGVVTVLSKYPAEQTVSRLESMLKDKGMTIFGKIDHAAQARQAGMQLAPSTLLIFGNPKGGTPIMQAAPTAGLDLPLKALVWQDAQGRSWISYNSPDYLQNRYEIPAERMKPLEGLPKLMLQAAQ
jgi:uncharacterized protein (DUF302 family)